MRIKTVLFVDDNAEMLRAWKREVGRERHVLTAETCAGAVEHARHQATELAIVDQRLDGERGLDVIDALRPLTDAIFVLMSCELSNEDYLNAFARDILAYPKASVWKPLVAICEAKATQSAATDSSLDSVDRDHIVRLMQRHENNITRTAKAVGLTRHGFKKKLVKFGLRS